MEQRVSLITLGCRDVDVAAKFYADMGWKRVDSPDGIVVFDLLCQVVGLYPLDALARDMGRDVAELGHGASTLSQNVGTKEDVDALTERAVSAGAKVLAAPHEVFWGGYIAYISDPEGHVWEFAHNPFSALGPNGEFRWNGY